MQRLLKLILPIGLVSFVVVVCISLWTVYSLQNAIVFERGATIVQGNVDDLYRYIQAAESSQRGYLLTGKQEYLSTYLDVTPKIPRALEDLKRNVANLPNHEKAVLQAESLIAKKLEELQFTIVLRQSEKGEEAYAIAPTDQGEELMAHIRTLLDRLDQAARLEAIRHEGFVRRYSSVLSATIAVGSLITLVLVMLFAYFSRQEIRRRARNEKDLLEAQEAALVASKMKSKFLATVSHEIRTPLNGIIGMSDLLRSRLREPESQRFVNIIHGSGLALLRIVNDILDFSKVEAGKVEFEYSEFSALEVVESSAELFSVKAREKKLSIFTYADPDIPTSLLGDSSRISQILRNMISNAIKFTDAGGLIVKARHRLQAGRKVTVRFEVQDTGSGISEQNLLHLFEPFTQVHQGGATVEGTGLGLSICKGLVENMGGRIGVESEVGRGSTFWFEIPLRSNGDATVGKLHPFNGSVASFLCVGRNPLLDQVVALYSAEFGLRTQSEVEFPIRAGSAVETVLIDVDTVPKDQIQNELVSNSGRVILIASDQFENFEAYRGRSGPLSILRLPFKREQLVGALNGVQAEAVEEMPVASPATAGDGGLVLLAEDNQTNQILAETLLAQMGYRVHTVANGAEAVEALMRVSYDLVLMDCQMPVMDGFEATKEIRLREGSLGSHTPIVAMTANAMASDREKCLSAGMDDFISKPFKASDLKVVLARWIRGGGKTNDPVDWTVLHDLAGNTDPKVVKRLIDSFLKTLPKTLAAIEKAKRENDNVAVGRWAHQLKASSASLGALELNRLCVEVEEASDASAEQLAELVDGLLSRGGEVHSAFQNQRYY